MNIIICGAGLVGISIAEYLARDGSNITVVDVSTKAVSYIKDRFDIRSIEGHASDPKILEQAEAFDADMLIAVTNNDEVNITACLIAHEIFSIPTRIVRIRNQNYLSEGNRSFLHKQSLASLVISPEQEVAKSLAQSLHYPGTIDAIPFFDGLVRVISAICPEDCPIIATPLKELTQLFPELSMRVLAIIRDSQLILPQSTEAIQVGDKVYFCIKSDEIERGLRALGIQSTPPSNIVIIGGGDIGQHLYNAYQDILGQQQRKVNVTIIEKNYELAKHIAKTLPDANVICDDGLNMDILRELKFEKLDSLCAVTNHDETNIFVALAAKKMGINNTLAILNSNIYHQIIQTLDIDVILHPREITTSSILHYVRYGNVHQAVALAGLQCELLDITISESSPIINKKIADIALPKGTHIGSINRQNDIIDVGGDTVLKRHDKVLIFTDSINIHKIEKIFAYN